jgi:hypothetical protein
MIPETDLPSGASLMPSNVIRQMEVDGETIE